MVYRRSREQLHQREFSWRFSAPRADVIDRSMHHYEEKETCTHSQPLSWQRGQRLKPRRRVKLRQRMSSWWCCLLGCRVDSKGFGSSSAIAWGGAQEREWGRGELGRKRRREGREISNIPTELARKVFWRMPTCGGACKEGQHKQKLVGPTGNTPNKLV